MVPLRGSPYTAAFISKAKPADNTMIGGAMSKYITKELETLNSFFAETKKLISTKDKESLKDVKTLLNIKEKTENTNEDWKLEMSFSLSVQRRKSTTRKRI